MKKLRITQKRYYAESRSSDSDPAKEIIDLSQISRNSSSWKKDDCISLKIHYLNVKTINDIIPNYIESLQSPYQSLTLETWDKAKFLSATDDMITSAKPSKVATIIRKIRNVVQNEKNRPFREAKVDSFIMSLMSYLGFDEEPLLMHPQYDYTTFVGEGRNITSKVEYMVTKKDLYMLMIIEDKHPKETSELTDWAEYQIAAEIFGSAYHNVNIASQHNIQIPYPVPIYAIRIIGTKFTFYKAEASRSYLEECATGLPIKNMLTIKRHPEQAPAQADRTRALTAWDFTDQAERKCILRALKALHSLFLKENFIGL